MTGNYADVFAVKHDRRNQTAMNTSCDFFFRHLQPDRRLFNRQRGIQIAAGWQAAGKLFGGFHARVRISPDLCACALVLRLGRECGIVRQVDLVLFGQRLGPFVHRVAYEVGDVLHP